MTKVETILSELQKGVTEFVSVMASITSRSENELKDLDARRKELDVLSKDLAKQSIDINGVRDTIQDALDVTKSQQNKFDAKKAELDKREKAIEKSESDLKTKQEAVAFEANEVRKDQAMINAKQKELEMVERSYSLTEKRLAVICKDKDIRAALEKFEKADKR